MENACVNDKTAAVPLIVKRLGRMAYEAVFQKMREFTVCL